MSWFIVKNTKKNINQRNQNNIQNRKPHSSAAEQKFRYQQKMIDNKQQKKRQHTPKRNLQLVPKRIVVFVHAQGRRKNRQQPNAYQNCIFSILQRFFACHNRLYY